MKHAQFGVSWSPHRDKQDFIGSEEDDVVRYEDTAELRDDDIEESLWYFTPFLPEGKRGKEEDVWDAEYEVMCDYEYLKGTTPDDVGWEGWQGEGNKHTTNLFYQLGLRLELAPLEDLGKTSKRKDPPFDHEVKIAELERQMRAFVEAAAGGSSTQTT